MITFELKKEKSQNETFFRFRLSSKYNAENIIVQFWFSVHNNTDIFSVYVCPTTNIFPNSGAKLYARINDDNQIEGFDINSASFDGSVEQTKEYLKELELACSIADEITQFFKTEFNDLYLNENESSAIVIKEIDNNKMYNCCSCGAVNYSQTSFKTVDKLFAILVGQSNQLETVLCKDCMSKLRDNISSKI